MYIALLSFILLVVIIFPFEVAGQVRDGLEFVVEVDGILLYRLAVDIDEVLD
jgi:hypothetical protein